MQRLMSGAAQMGLNLSAPQVAAFDLYTDELLAWNEQFNLTAITDREQVEIRHYLDSLALLPALAALEGVSLTTLLSRSIRAVDVGAGAGLPGLALRMVWPRMRLSLVEATAKKVRFMEHVAANLALTDLQFIHGRAEELALREPHRATYDLVVARAVATLPTLVEYLLPLAKRGGRVVAYKGSAAHEEALAAEQAIRMLGGRLTRLIPVEVPGLAETRVLVVIDKVAQTTRAGAGCRRSSRWGARKIRIVRMSRKDDWQAFRRPEWELCHLGGFVLYSQWCGIIVHESV
jgi:16S rRNA (guanine527-N7)-methyltransferase